VIGQATGNLLERFDLDPDKAFDGLRRVSIQSNIKLVQIPEELVSTGKTPGTD
jgi:AmiR/NasT family two-component response regulator